jgi:hypothetical protein
MLLTMPKTSSAVSGGTQRASLNAGTMSKAVRGGIFLDSK